MLMYPAHSNLIQNIVIWSALQNAHLTQHLAISLVRKLKSL